MRYEATEKDIPIKCLKVEIEALTAAADDAEVKIESIEAQIKAN